MRKRFLLVCLSASFGSMLFAEPDEAKLREAMKMIGPTCSGLGKKITAKDATSAEDAKKLAKAFGDVEKWWKQKHADDAVGFSKAAKAEFSAIAKQADAGNWDGAGATFKKATANCGGCHSAHREKGEGGWKIK